MQAADSPENRAGEFFSQEQLACCQAEEIVIALAGPHSLMVEHYKASDAATHTMNCMCLKGGKMNGGGHAKVHCWR